MWKKMVLTSAATIFVMAAFPPLSAAEYRHSGCGKAAQMRFPTDHVARKEFKHWCKDQRKIYKASQKANA
jgi:hypothetical protein